jgi:hypothetical protein
VASGVLEDSDQAGVDRPRASLLAGVLLVVD